MKICPECGQTIREYPADKYILTPLQRKVYERIKKAGNNGIDSDDLFYYIYRNDSDGGPVSGKTVLYVMINKINRELAYHGNQEIGTVYGTRHGPASYVLRDKK